MAVAGVTNLYVKQLPSGKLDVSAIQAEGAKEINPIKLAQKLNDVLELTPPIIVADVQKLISLLKELDVGSEGESILDKLMDGVSQIDSGFLQGKKDSHFTDAGLAAVKTVLDAWLKNQTESTKKALTDTLTSNIWSSDDPVADSKVKKSADLAGFLASMPEAKVDVNPATKVEQTDVVADVAISLEELMKKVITGKLELKDLEGKSLPDEVIGILPVGLNDQEKVNILNVLGEIKYFGEVSDYGKDSKGIEKKGVFTKNGETIGITYAGGRAFQDKFFKLAGDGKIQVDSKGLKDGIAALVKSYDAAHMRGSKAELGTFARDYVTASAYKVRVMSDTEKKASVHVARQLSTTELPVTAPQMASLAADFANKFPPNASTPLSQIVASESQLKVNGDKLELSVKGVGDKFKIVASFKKDDWDKFLAFMDKQENNHKLDETQKKLWFLNMLELLAQDPTDGMTIYKDSDVKETEDIRVKTTEVTKKAWEGALTKVKGAAKAPDILTSLQGSKLDSTKLMYWEDEKPAVKARAAVPGSWKPVFVEDKGDLNLATNFEAKKNYAFSVEGFIPEGAKSVSPDKFVVNITFNNNISAGLAGSVITVPSQEKTENGDQPTVQTGEEEAKYKANTAAVLTKINDNMNVENGYMLVLKEIAQHIKMEANGPIAECSFDEKVTISDKLANDLEISGEKSLGEIYQASQKKLSKSMKVILDDVNMSLKQRKDQIDKLFKEAGTEKLNPKLFTAVKAALINIAKQNVEGLKGKDVKELATALRDALDVGVPKDTPVEISKNQLLKTALGLVGEGIVLPTTYEALLNLCNEKLKEIVVNSTDGSSLSDGNQKLSDLFIIPDDNKDLQILVMKNNGGKEEAVDVWGKGAYVPYASIKGAQIQYSASSNAGTGDSFILKYKYSGQGQEKSVGFNCTVPSTK
jgi:hypothetical protein